MSIVDSLQQRYAQAMLPVQVTLELTYRCNERCSHCYLSTYDDNADGRPTLKLEEWKRILDELAAAKAFYLILIGGEAMMHPQFWGIAEHAASRNFALSLITNGLLIDEASADRFASLSFDLITLSLYSMNPAVHDKMTRKFGSWARTMAAIKRLKRAGVGVRINCLLTSENIEGWLDVKNWANSEGFAVQFDPTVTSKNDRSLGSTVTRATADQLRHYYRTLKKMGSVSMPQPVGDLDDPVCNAGRGKAAVSPYGDLLTCLEVREAIGNLREHSFDQLWHSDRAQRLRGYRVRDLKYEPSCGAGSFCDHCPGMAESETGDPMKPVPFLMEIAAIKKQIFEEPSPLVPLNNDEISLFLPPPVTV